MPYKIVKQGDQWCVHKEADDKNMGCHDTEAEAKAQMAALYANEKKTHIGDIERRLMGPVELRAASEDRPARLVGYAAIFNLRSDDLGGFREIIIPGAFDRALSEGHDVRALVNHNPDKMLGRTASKTARLAVDEHGLHVEVDVPDTQDGRDTLTLVQRGDLSQMSFAFRTLSDEWRTEDGEPLRELRDVELFDVSVVAFPAYSATEVSLRALERAREIVTPPMIAPAPAPVERLSRQIQALEREEE